MIEQEQEIPTEDLDLNEEDEEDEIIEFDVDEFEE
jgi:hypothetical protein